MTYLDTHIVVWLYDGRVDLLSPAAQDQIEDEDLLISPMVMLEIEYLNEIGRLRTSGRRLIGTLSKEIALRICELPFQTIVEQALEEIRIRDPFDRLIVAQAKANDAPLVTRDRRIRRNYKRAVW